MLAIVLQVAANALDLNPLVRFEAPVPLLGRAVTLNSLLDLQWHMLALLGLLPAGLVWLRDAHVRVDFLHRHYPTRWRARLDLAGHVLFALPFLVMMLPAAMQFVQRAWRTDEGSRSGGLDDRWAIKAALPLGLGLLALCVAIEALRLLRAAR